MEKLIILIVLVTGVIALAQLVRVYELSSKLKDRGEHDITDRDNHSECEAYACVYDVSIPWFYIFNA